jgi:hypothetical protein
MAAPCPSPSIYKVPYSYGSNTVVGDLYLGIPLVRMNLPWSQIGTGSASDGADLALKELLTAVYQNNDDLAKRHLLPEQVAKFGGTQAFLASFRSSLLTAGNLVVLGRLEEDPDAVRFVLDGDLAKAYRVLTLRRNGTQGYVLDNSVPPTAAGALELLIFRLDKSLKLEANIDLSLYASLEIGSHTNACSPVLLAHVERTGKNLFNKEYVSPNPALHLYQQCHTALELGRTEDFFACFGPDAAKMSGTFNQLNTSQQTIFVDRQLTGIEPAFIMGGAQLTVLFYQRLTPPSVSLAHQNIIGVGSSFELVNPMTSNVLDDVLNGKELQDGLKKSATASRSQ